MNEYYKAKLDQVNSDQYQKDALNSIDSTVVLAGPGSGKTTVLTLKIMNLLDGYIKEPRGLACITYSREAAREFEERLVKCGFTKRKNVFLGTVHSFCLSEIIRPFSDIYDLGVPKDYAIVSEKESKEIFEEAKKEKKLDYKYEEMNKERNLCIDGTSSVEHSLNSDLIDLAECYEKKLFDKGLIDFDSIIISSVKAIQGNSYIRRCLSSKYEWLIIDEYQDLGHPLHEMVLSLYEMTGIKIFAVGDSDQSIYGFSGANPEYLLELSRKSGIKKINLINNYRSNQDIIKGSEIVLNEIRNYVAKTRNGENARYEFYGCTNGDEDQFEFVSTTLVSKYHSEKIPYDEIAILVSRNGQCKELAKKLKKNNIPCYISKHDFKVTDFVKWLIDCSKYVSGDKTMLSELFAFWHSLPFVKETLNDDNDVISEKKRLMRILDSSKIMANDVEGWVKYIINQSKLDEHLLHSTDYPDELDNLNALCKELKTDAYSDFNVSMFGKIGKPTNQVTISTRHSSKGLEFEAVIMCGMEEGHFPGWQSKKDKEKEKEEDRLCFVCVSRAKKICTLIYSQKFYEGRDKHLNTYSPSKYYIALKKEFGK